MTIRQSQRAIGQRPVPQAFTSGAVVAYLAEFIIPAGMTIGAGDIVELAVLPADHRIVDAQILPTGNFGAGVTADVGIMSGAVGSTDPARTVGNELFAAVATNAFGRLVKGDAIVLDHSNSDRSIGVKFSAAVTGAGQILRLQVLMTQ